PGHRPLPEAALAATAWSALRAGDQDRTAPAPGQRDAPCGVWPLRSGPPLVTLTPPFVFGTLDRVNAVLAACGWQINTAFVERLNLDLRQHVAAIGRRGATLSTGEGGFRERLALFQTYHNFCLPHASLRQPLSQPLPTKGTGSAKQWRPCTPAMGAGLTDRGGA